MLDDPSWLRDHGIEYHTFAILSMCRALHALDHGGIVSKPVAAKWAQGELGSKWIPVIEQALIAQAGKKDFDLYDDTLELIGYTMDKVDAAEKSKTGEITISQ